jgi:hypothetical protein
MPRTGRGVVYQHLLLSHDTGDEAHRLYLLYDFLIYSCLLLQIVISAVLIIIGAHAGDHHLVVSILGAATGIIVGVMSLIKSQGFPTRLVQYRDALRRVREDIEFTERELRAGRRIVTYGEIVTFKKAYESVREDEVKNSPDVWNAGVGSIVGKSNTGGSGHASKSRTAEAMV